MNDRVLGIKSKDWWFKSRFENCFLVRIVVVMTEPAAASLSKEIYCKSLVVHFIVPQDQEVKYRHILGIKTENSATRSLSLFKLHGSLHLLSLILVCQLHFIFLTIFFCLLILVWLSKIISWSFRLYCGPLFPMLHLVDSVLFVFWFKSPGQSYGLFVFWSDIYTCSIW